MQSFPRKIRHNRFHRMNGADFKNQFIIYLHK